MEIKDENKGSGRGWGGGTHHLGMNQPKMSSGCRHLNQLSK